MSLKNKSKAYYFATICTLASVLGGVAGYYIGVFAMEQIGPLLDNLGYQPKIDEIQDWYLKYNFWIILIAGFSPIPYKLFTISAGMMTIPLIPFVAFSLIARGARYFLVSFLVRKLGKMADQWLNKYIDWLGYLLIFIIILFVWYEY
jgi:membrane protein YqaA with SNARE-associated domain